MIEYGVVDAKKQDQESLIKELNTLAKEGWSVVCSLGRSNEGLLLVREVEVRIPNQENEEVK